MAGGSKAMNGVKLGTLPWALPPAVITNRPPQAAAPVLVFSGKATPSRIFWNVSGVGGPPGA